MARQAVIFDVDYILLDSGAAEEARQERRWGDVYKMIPRLPPYEGLSELFKKLAARNVALGVATGRPARYVELILKRWGFPFNARVCFGDFKLPKPSPESTLLCLQRLGVKPEDTVAVGVFPADIRAARAAGVYSVAAQWGTGPIDDVLETCPDAECSSVEDLQSLLKARFAL